MMSDSREEASLAVMPVGPILLTIVVVLIYAGFLGGTLERIGLGNRAGALLAVGMLLGSLIEIPLWKGASINLGGGLLPLGLVLYLLITGERRCETRRGVLAALAASAGVYLVGQWVPPGEPTELNLFFLDAQYLYGATAGAVGYAVGRWHRAAFCGGVLGVLLGDLGHCLNRAAQGLPPVPTIQIGGGGFHETAAVAGVLAVALAELVGERREVTVKEMKRG